MKKKSIEKVWNGQEELTVGMDYLAMIFCLLPFLPAASSLHMSQLILMTWFHLILATQWSRWISYKSERPGLQLLRFYNTALYLLL